MRERWECVAHGTVMYPVGSKNESFAGTGLGAAPEYA